MSINKNAIGKICRLLATIVAGILLFPTIPMRGQTDMQLTQYWATPTYYNPAAAGTTDFLRIRGAGKLQWLGIENAPQSFMGAADIPFRLVGKHLGAGVNVMSEKLGLFTNLQLNAQLNYQMKLGKGYLSIGVQPAYFSSRFRGTDIYIPDGDEFHQPSDEAIPTQDLSGNAFDISAGLRYSHKYFSVGASCMHILAPKVNLTLEDSQNNESHEFETEMPRQFYFMADGNIPIKNTLIVLQPSTLLRTDLQTITADFTLRATYNHFLTAGVAYRMNSAISLMLGAEFKNFLLGYAYDLPINGIGKVSSGSHELVVGYSLKLNFSGKNKNKHRSIRIM